MCAVRSPQQVTSSSRSSRGRLLNPSLECSSSIWGFRGPDTHPGARASSALALRAVCVVPVPRFESSHRVRIRSRFVLNKIDRPGFLGRGRMLVLISKHPRRCQKRIRYQYQRRHRRKISLLRIS
ncbi:hypothetical protein PGTUg99_020579 [Puccinia graminis f. sp. tritici]|uniref:Uncharacterized protein n=1 Tax=Puccinia graminis f. sp. tritici TaxID=56615 RepID=A0A5B0M9K4_PUCGR|nr:hypothetical protein PGTUg99_020579 [Puccinia graminis f. sp. tritici]